MGNRPDGTMGSQIVKTADIATTKLAAYLLETFLATGNTRRVISLATLFKPVLNLAQATQDLTEAQSGEIFVGNVDVVFTLPAIADVAEGTNFTAVCGALSSGTGLSISPAAADKISGGGMVGADDKDAINTGSSDVVGDSLTVTSDGVDWLVTNKIGTWAVES